MAVIEIEFACRCGRQNVDPDKNPSPVCLLCGETRVARVHNCPPPRFTGCVTGPYATTVNLAPVAIKVGTANIQPAPDAVPAAERGVQ